MTATSARKRLAILLPCLLKGGTEVATLETALALRSLGFDVEVVVYFDEIDAGMRETFEVQGVRVAALGLRRGQSVARLALRLARALGRRDLVWLQYMTPTLVPLLVARGLTRRLVAAVHVGASHLGDGALRRLRWLGRRVCDRVVCVSETSAKGLFGDPGSSARARVRVIANAVDTAAAARAEAADWRARAGWPRDAVVVGYLGRLARIKGPDLLVSAFATLATQRPALRLVLAGAGEREAALRQQVAASALADRVHFAGPIPRDAVFAALRGFDLAVVPSREEGFGLSAAEALAAGAATVATRVGALPEVLADGRNGVLVDPDSPAALAQGMAGLLDDGGLRARLGAAGADDMARRFGRAALRQSLADLLASLGLGTEDRR